MTDEFDAAVAATLRSNKAQEARVGFTLGSDSNPDAYAEAQRVARSTGVPVDTVFAMPQEMKRQATVGSIDFESLAATSPATAALLADIEKAKIAHDNLPSLTAMERSLTGNITEPIRRGLAQGRRGMTLLLDQAGLFGGLDAKRAEVAAAHGVPYSASAGVAVQLAEQSRDAGRFPAPESVARGMQDISGAKTLGDAVAAVVSNPRAVFETTLESLGTSAPALVGAIGGSIVGPAGTAAGAGLGSFSVEYASTLQDVMGEKGVNASDPMAVAAALNNPELMAAAREKALKRGIPVAMFDAITAGVAGKLLAGAKPGVVSAASRTAGELGIQAGGGAAGEAAAQAATGEYKPGDILMEAVAELPTAGIEVPANWRHAVEHAQIAERGAQLIENINKIAAADKLLARDPDSFQQFVAQAAENGPVDAVYIDAKALMQTGLGGELAKVSPAVAGQLDAAIVSGGQVAIPIDEYAARIAPTQYAQALQDHLKVDPEGFSRAEAQQFVETQGAELEAQVARAVSEAQNDDAFKASADLVRKNIADQLDSVGRFRTPVSDTYATLVGNFYAVMAARVGVSPEDLFRQFPLQVVSDVTGDSVVLNQYSAEELAFLKEQGVIDDAEATRLASDIRDRPGNTGRQDAITTLAGGNPTQGWAGATRISRAGSGPATVFRGSTTGLNASHFGVDSLGVASGNPSSGLGVWFSTTHSDAARHGNVEEFKLDVRNPKIMGFDELPAFDSKEQAHAFREALRAEGYDGIVLTGRHLGKVGSHIVAFDPSQVIRERGSFKQSTGHRGAFDPASLSIALLKDADLSTFLHESGHFFLEVIANLASRADAPDAVRQDMTALLKWFGVGSLEEWNKLDIEGKRAYHEQFARGFEAYLFEGKAPNVELQGIFQRVRAWMLQIYKNLKSLNVELSDEVRSVFDRMLATNEQINIAEQTRGMGALFAAADQAGMTAEEFANYQAVGVDATNEAIQNLQSKSLRDMKWLRNARSKYIKQLQSQAKSKRAEVRDAVKEEIMAEPIYQAWEFLKSKEASLSRDALDEMYGGIVDGKRDRYALLDWKRLSDLRMTADQGEHPDLMAEIFGFSSGDELVRKLISVEKPDVAIDQLTDVRMLEEYGELTDQAAIERAADVAVYNDVRARFVASELNALDKAVGNRKLLTSAAKSFAEVLIGRLKIRDISPGQYARASERATKAADRALKVGDTAAAAAEKRNQLLQHYAARAAYAAQDEVDAGLRYLRKFDKHIKALDSQYAAQIHNLLARFNLRKSTTNKAAAFSEWLAAQREAGIEPEVPAELQNEAFQTSYKNLTLEEFRGLVETIKQIDHLGRHVNRLLTAQRQQEYETVRDKIVAGIRDHAQGRKANTRSPVTKGDRVIRGLKRFWASHIKAATWARIMDGGVDGGPMWEYFIRSANERGDQEATMIADATKRLSEILAPVFAAGKMGGKGQYFPSINMSLNRESRIAIALNMGNEGNIQRLLGGEGWELQQVVPVLQSLTAAEWKAVQDVWDHFESYRPKIAAKEMRVYGVEPQWVKPKEFDIVTADGKQLTIKGGYYPIKYDPAASQRAEQHADAEDAKRQLQGAYTSTTTRRSFTKARVEEVTGRPLLYSLAGMYSGVGDVIHDLAWHEWLIDMNKLLRSHSIDTAIRETYGPEVKRQFKNWERDVADGNRASDAALDEALGRLRQGISAAGLGFNVMTAFIQPLGVTQSIVRVGGHWIGRGVVKYLAAPVTLTRQINTMSEFMANRSRTRFRELNELRNQVQDQNAFKELAGRYAYWAMMRFQQMVDVPTWQGAYEKAIAEGNDDARAIALADQAVIDSQGGGQLKDLSAIERGGPAQKLFTVFYSFMNTALNIGVSQTMSADSPAKRAKLASDYLLLYVAPPILGYMLKEALTPGDSGDDSWEKLSQRLIAEQLGFLMGLMVVVREFGEAGKIMAGTPSFGYQGPAGVRVVSDTLKASQQARQGEFDDAFRKAMLNLIGDLSGLPAAQANRTITGVKALVEGKTANPAAIAFGFQEKREK